MKVKRVTGTVSALVLGCLAFAGNARADCKFSRVVEVPVTIENFRPVVAVKINGKDAKLFVDTGAFFSAVSDESAKSLEMKPTATPYGLTISGIGGASRDARAVEATEFTFENVRFRNIQFLVGGRVGGGGLSGMIGENVLTPFEVEYDFANGVMRFFRAEGCGDANLAYWSAGKALSRIPLEMPGKFLTQIHTTGKINGRSIHVVLDSGVALSILSRPAAVRAGITIASEGVTSAGITYGIFGEAQENFIASFASFAIGEEEIKNTRLRMANIKLPETDMLLGMDFFLSHRLLVSPSQKKIYFTYNGGPVFRLDQGAPVTQTAQADAKAVNATADQASSPSGAEVPKTAAEFARRAAALATRRSFAEAIADYTQAISLDAANAGYYRSRALAQLGAGHAVLAMADLDEALKRQPNDPDTLMRRGQLYLASRDSARAKADFLAAMKLSPENNDLIGEAAASYVNYGLYEDGIRALDEWVAAHLKGYDLSQAQAARCFARAAWGQQLDQALADCDAALRRDRNSVFLRSRALVLLRSGRLDEASNQYSDVIKLQPRDAMALYGRGLAEIRSGKKAAGDADLAAATAISANVAALYKRWGITPDGPSAASPPAKS